MTRQPKECLKIDLFTAILTDPPLPSNLALCSIEPELKKFDCKKPNETSKKEGEPCALLHQKLVT
jgi:hypothetical protein